MFPTNIGIARCTVSVATIVVVGAGGRHLSYNKIFISLTQRWNASAGVRIVGEKTLLQLVTKFTLAILVGVFYYCGTKRQGVKCIPKSMTVQVFRHLTFKGRNGGRKKDCWKLRGILSLCTSWAMSSAAAAISMEFQKNCRRLSFRQLD